MRFENRFSVDSPIEDVWAALLDVERIAPSLPGAEVLEQTGEDAYLAQIRVKVGPVALQYRGDVEIVERDEIDHRAALSVRVRETRGQGTANATVAMALTESDGQTHTTLETDVQLAGKAASMAQGVVAGVSERLVAQFAQNLAAELAAPGAAAPEGAGAAEPSELSAASIAVGMATDRLRDPRVAAALGALAGSLATAAILRRRHRRR